MSVFDAKLYAASCAPQYTARLSSHSRVVSLVIDNEAAKDAITRPGYAHRASLLRSMRDLAPALFLSGSTVQAGWAPSQTGNQASPCQGDGAGDEIGFDTWRWWIWWQMQ